MKTTFKMVARAIKDFFDRIAGREADRVFRLLDRVLRRSVSGRPKKYVDLFEVLTAIFAKSSN